ncbi:MAG: FHA domain-containing protein [Pseudonocardiaceae bacterium]
MTSYLEVRGPSGVELVPLSGDRVAIGRGPDNTIRLDHDRQASQLHAVIESIGSSWCVRDLGSRNGTHLGDDRILGDRVLRHGDELLLGQTRVTFRSEGPSGVAPTEGAAPPPS